MVPTLRGAGYSTRPGRLHFSTMPIMPPRPKRCAGVYTPAQRFGHFNYSKIVNSPVGVYTIRATCFLGLRNRFYYLIISSTPAGTRSS